DRVVGTPRIGGGEVRTLDDDRRQIAVWEGDRARIAAEGLARHPYLNRRHPPFFMRGPMNEQRIGGWLIILDDDGPGGEDNLVNPDTPLLVALKEAIAKSAHRSASGVRLEPQQREPNRLQHLVGTR